MVIAIMDGVGVGAADAGDAVHLARTPFLDSLGFAPYTTLAAHGTAVGLPSDADMGNSEVGHNALGCGRVFEQGAKLVEQAIGSRALFEGDVWRWVTQSGTLHFIGLLSDGNVHSHERHLHALLRAAAEQGVARARVHILTDGRDVAPRSALGYIERLEATLAELPGDYRIASGGGRMIVTMDRYEADWRIVERGWNVHVHAEGRRFDTAAEAVRTFYDEDPDVTDQHLPPFVVGAPSPMHDGDGVVLFNFRGDRAIEITRAFEDGDDFAGFDRGRRPRVRFAGLMQYDGDLALPAHFLVTPPAIDRTLGEYLVRAQVPLWACSETQKFGHVTYFWNGNRSGVLDDAYETWLEIPSDRLPFEQRPWMKAAEITDATIAAIQSNAYRLLRINYPNGDMVGHTGNLRSAILAVESVDLCLARLWRSVSRVRGTLLITADHGNCDEMLKHDKAGALTPQISTSHSLAAVPLHVLGGPGNRVLRSGGGLANVAATTLELLGFEAPDDYDNSLLIG